MYQAPPTNPQEDILTEEPLFHLARKTKRYFAAFIDFVIAGVLMGILLYCFGEPYVNEEGTTGYHLSGWPGFAVMFTSWFLPLPLIEIINNGQTLGKAIFRIRSAAMDGSKISASAAFARHLFDFIDWIPFAGIVGVLVASNNSRKQRVGDLIAKTIVIDA